MKSKTLISFVVDASPKFYFKAELLIYSLLQNTSFTHKDIIAHCVEGVSEKFIAFLKEKDIQYYFIKPFLDGKFCNKLTQLPQLLRYKKNIILVDTDTYFLSTPKIPNPNTFCAKIVDAPNPPLRVLQKIYAQAKIPLPKTHKTDWNIEGGKTLTTNFNGGFYYIPFKYAEKINTSWQKWATYLFKNKEFFENKQQINHIDQIAMSLTIAETNIPFQHLASNENYPMHRKEKTRFFNNKERFTALHYHHLLHSFGLLDLYKGKENAVIQAIKKANAQIAEQPFVFDLDYRMSFTKPIEHNEKTEQFRAILSTIKTKKKIILHAGTSKSGTTSLQFYFYKNRDLLEKHNISYAYNISTNTYAPKHQWIVNNLLAEDTVAFANHLKESVESTKSDTVFLSTEGIYNHWWDYSGVSKSCLQVIGELFDTNLIVTLREQEDFIYSLYKQFCRNRAPKNFLYPYSRSSSFNTTFHDKWFRKHLDYYSFLKETESVFGKEKVAFIPYNKQIITTYLQHLNIEEQLTPKKRENLPLSNLTVLVYRQINRFFKKPKINKYLKLKVLEVTRFLVKVFGDIPKQNSSYEWKQLIKKEKALMEKEYGLKF